MKKLFFLLLFLCSFLKADSKIEAYFLNERAGTEDIIDFIIRIEGEVEDTSKPFLQSNEDFQILSGPSISTSVQIVNFNMKKSIEYRWKVNPKKEGLCTMPSIEIQIGKKIYKTNPVTIEVVKGSVARKSQPQIPSIFDDFFEEPKRKTQRAEILVQAVPNKTECFVGEAVLITYNLLTQTSIQNISLSEPPTYDGFWVENLSMPQTPEGKRVEIDDKQFVLYTIKKDLLFPNSEGFKKINEVSFQIQAITQRDFFGFPQVENIIRKTKPILIKVKALPQTNFLNFKGAVGKFSLSLVSDKVQVEEGEAFSLKLKLSGTGNFKNITNLEIPEMLLCKVYPPKVEEKINPSPDGYQGTKVWEWVVVPEEKQNIKIPEISFVYFDPNKKEYIETKTSPLNIFVKKGKEKRSEEVFVAKGKEIREIAKDIGYIIVDGKNLKRKENNNSLIYLIFIVPLFFNLFIFVLKKIKGRKLSESERFEKEAMNYYKKAKKFLKEKNEEEFLKNVEKSIKVMATGDPEITIDGFLEKIKSFEEKDKILKFLSLLQDMRFNPLTKTEKTIDDIEKEGLQWLKKLKSL